MGFAASTVQSSLLVALFVFMNFNQNICKQKPMACISLGLFPIFQTDASALFLFLLFNTTDLEE